MMSLQARQYFDPKRPCLPLRTYGSNSPHARGRLVAAAMLADGQFSPAEMQEIAEGSIATPLGLERDEFIQVVFELCEDIEQKLKPLGKDLHDREVLEQLFGELSHPATQRNTLSAIRTAITRDGRVSPGEAVFLKSAASAWRTDTDSRL